MTELLDILAWPLAVVLCAKFIASAGTDLAKHWVEEHYDVEMAKLDESVDVDLSALQGTPGADQLKMHRVGTHDKVVAPSDAVESGDFSYHIPSIADRALATERVFSCVEVDGGTPAVVAEPRRVPSLAERTALYETLMQSAVLTYKARNPCACRDAEIVAKAMLLARL